MLGWNEHMKKKWEYSPPPPGSCWRRWQTAYMLEQSCRTDQIKTHYPTNITQGISAHPAASFPKINRYWKNTRHLERSKMYPQFTKKAKNPTASNYRPISLTVSCAKFWSILLLLAWLNTSLNWTYFMKCSMASEKRDPVRRNLLMKYLKTCRWANILILFFWT